MSPSARAIVRKASGVLASIPWWIWAIAAVALAARLAVVGYGLPYEFDPDERAFVDPAWRMIESGSFDPGFYGHPAATLMDALAGMYASYGFMGVLLGSFDSVSGAGEAYRADVTHFFIIGRFVAAISGVAVVLTTYAVLRELRASAFWAALAALSLAVSFPMIQFSTLVRADMLLTAFLMAVVLVMLRALDKPSGAAFALAGVFMGLAVTSKYPGVLAVAPILIANITLVLERRITPRRGLRWLAAAALASVVTAFIVAPYLFINIGDTLMAVRQEAGAGNPSAIGAGPIGNLWSYLTEALPWGLGFFATVAAVVGLLVMLASRRPRLASLTFWALLAAISALSQWWYRWALPLVPFAAIGAAFLLSLLDTRLAAWRPGRWLIPVRVVVACLLVFPLLGPSITNVQAEARNDDTRLKAIDWLHANVPDGSTLLIDSYTTQVSSDRYDVLIAKGGELVRWSDVDPKLRPDGYFATMAGEWYGTPEELLAAIKVEQVDYVVLTDLWINLFRDQAVTYPAQLATYEALLEAFPVVESFDSSDAPIGWPITILQASGVIATN
jgi:hypothetical protein